MHLLPKFAVVVILIGLGCIAPSPVAAEPERELQNKIASAVERAVKYLKRTQNRHDGMWYHIGPAEGTGPQLEQNIGATALCAVAMLEAGVDINDAGIQKAATLVRSRAETLTYTYSIAAAIIFLDRINTGNDGPTIRNLAQKLISGQQPRGCWSYYCPSQGGAEDSSNTQFAVLGLWIAHDRHGFKANRAFDLAEQRFRANQQADGGWGYQFTGGPLGTSSQSMTCAGLLVLAIAHAARHKAQAEAQLVGTDPDAPGAAAPRPAQPKAFPELRKDPQVLLARDYIARYMAQGFSPDQHSVYFLWSLERVCLVLDYKDINGIDWYTWGAQHLLNMQSKSGAWQHDFVSGSNCETAWALLFLKKVDLLQIGRAVFEPGKIPQNRRGNKQPAQAPKKVDAGRKGTPGEAQALKEELQKTVVAERIEEIIDLLEKTTGSEYLEALVEVIPLVRAGVQDQVRQALQRRLARLKQPENLRKGLSSDNNKELRLAILAVLRTKSDVRSLVPDLIPLLGEKDAEISIQAYETLKKITGQDHGRNQGAWLQWWERQPK